MAKTGKTEKNTLKTQGSKTPRSKADLIEVTDVEKAEKPKPDKSTAISTALSSDERQLMRRLGAKLLTQAQVDASVSIGCPDNKALDLALKHGSLGLLDEFAPADAVESTFAPVIVALRNALMTSFRLATEGSPERRDIELNTALKGAGVLADLLQGFDAHRGHGNRRVSVGNVNVESGAQAIVGNIEAPTARHEPTTEASAVEPNKGKPRAT